MEIVFSDVGCRISKRIKELSLKQLDVCNKTGLSTTALSQYCTEKRVPDTVSLYKLAMALDVSMEWILTGEDLTDEDSSAAPPDLEEVKREQGLACDGLPLDEAEVDLVTMFRLLPPSHQEEVFDLVYFKYKRHVEQKKESIFSTYTRGGGTQKSDPVEGREAQGGIA